MALKSSVNNARKNTRSLRTTIPEGIVDFLELNDGDKIEWNMKYVKSKRFLLVEKI